MALQFHLMEGKKMSPPAMSALMGIISIPWCFKPLIGLFSDSVPIRGMHRKPYIIIGLVIAGLSWWLLPYTDDGLGLSLFTGSFGLCVADVACDSLLVVAARNENKDQKGTVQSWAWGLRASGGLLASIVGPISYNNIGAELTFTINGCIPLLFSLTIPILAEEVVAKNKRLSGKTQVKRLFDAFKEPQIWQPALFIILLNVTPGYGTVLAYFFERILKFTPYNFATLDIVGSISAILGTFLYKKYLTNVPLRRLFFWTILAAWVLRWMHLVLITRIVPQIDMVFAVAESVALTLVSQAILLPTVVMVAKIVPKGLEGSLYATCMSLSNLSGVVSTEWGSLMAESMAITRDNFDGLLKLAVLCNIIGIVPLFATRLVSQDLDAKPEEEEEEDVSDSQA